MGFEHREQPKIGEERIRPLYVIKAASSLTWPVLLSAQNRPQTAADKAVDRREYQPMGMLEVAKSAAHGRVERSNHIAAEDVPCRVVGVHDPLAALDRHAGERAIRAGEDCQPIRGILWPSMMQLSTMSYVNGSIMQIAFGFAFAPVAEWATAAHIIMLIVLVVISAVISSLSPLVYQRLGLCRMGALEIAIAITLHSKYRRALYACQR